MLSIGTEGSALSPGSIAAGAGDAFLVRLNGLIAEHGDVVYVRPLSEMNNGNNLYSAYDLSGRSRGPAYSTQLLKRAWRRLALILRGGSVESIDSRLRGLGMPPVATGAGEPPAPSWRPRVLLLFGNPEIAKNHPRHWCTGGAYVDWVDHLVLALQGFLGDAPRTRTCSGTTSPSRSPSGACGPRRSGLRAPVLRLPEVARARAHGGLLPVRPALAGVQPLEPPATSAALRRMSRWPRLAGAAGWSAG